jgi:hypothetical protein
VLRRQLPRRISNSRNEPNISHCLTQYHNVHQINRDFPYCKDKELPEMQSQPATHMGVYKSGKCWDLVITPALLGIGLAWGANGVGITRVKVGWEGCRYPTKYWWYEWSSLQDWWNSKYTHEPQICTSYHNCYFICFPYELRFPQINSRPVSHEALF